MNSIRRLSIYNPCLFRSVTLLYNGTDIANFLQSLTSDVRSWRKQNKLQSNEHEDIDEALLAIEDLTDDYLNNPTISAEKIEETLSSKEKMSCNVIRNNWIEDQNGLLFRLFKKVPYR